MQRPNWLRVAAAILAAILVAPFFSPAFLAWMVVVAEGAESAKEFLLGISAGALIGMQFGFILLFAGIAIVALVVLIKFEQWAPASWFRWALLGAGVDLAGCVLVVLIADGYPNVPLILFLLVVTLPSAIASTLVFRRIMLPSPSAKLESGAA